MATLDQCALLTAACRRYGDRAIVTARGTTGAQAGKAISLSLCPWCREGLEAACRAAESEVSIDRHRSIGQ